MGEGFIVRKGGVGISNGAIKKSTIIVKYPIGSICTCTNGTVTYTALDDSGAAAFAVGIGEWIITSTDGTYTASENINITFEGQIEIVTLEYDLILYKPGMTEGVTGLGWQSGSYQVKLIPDITYAEDALYIQYTASNIGGRTGVAYWGPINLTEYSSIEVELTMEGITTASYATANGLFVWTTVGSGYYPVTAIAKDQIASNDETLLTVDISSITGEHYIGMGLRRGDTKPTYRITKASVKR